ncbi:hypothetical protein SDC9_98063 [bioreactor metagenome]|uniref:Uncharacterized protein n=1 Tax=bioreactor metagenome TaxID=1076179 RepID=A0A645ADN0_9ZZZZ
MYPCAIGKGGGEVVPPLAQILKHGDKTLPPTGVGKPRDQVRPVVDQGHNRAHQGHDAQDNPGDGVGQQGRAELESADGHHFKDHSQVGSGKGENPHRRFDEDKEHLQLAEQANERPEDCCQPQKGQLVGGNDQAENAHDARKGNGSDNDEAQFAG